MLLRDIASQWRECDASRVEREDLDVERYEVEQKLERINGMPQPIYWGCQMEGGFGCQIEG